jgi:hypothetical protein
VADNYPSTAYYLTLIGAILIVLDAIVTIAVGGSFAGSLGVLGAAAAAVIVVLGIVGLIVGLIILYGALQLKKGAPTSRTWGLFVIVLAVVSLFTGSGFFIGFILALIGGILAYTWKPPITATPSWNASPAMSGWGTPSAAAPAAPLPPSGGTAGQKFCAHCGSANAASATFCAHCGAPLTP